MDLVKKIVNWKFYKFVYFNLDLELFTQERNKLWNYSRFRFTCKHANCKPKIDKEKDKHEQK
jgi:hypothetical protein